jgi:anti-sigma B factor antagonist
MIDLAINVIQTKGWQIITLKGELDDYQASKLTKTFNKIFEQGDCNQIVLNLDEVSFVDSVGLGTIAIAGKKLLEKSGQLHLVCTQQKITQMVNLSGIVSATKETIKLFDTNEAAIAATSLL